MKIIVFSLVFVLSYAQDISVSKSWSLLGATDNLTSSFFTSDCADSVWTYKNGAWSNDKSISKGEGFWIYSKNGNCTLSTTSTTSTTATKSYATDVYPILQSNCTTSCHVVGGGAEGTRLVVSDASSTYAGVKTLVDVVNGASSTLLLKATAVSSHGGGKVFDVSSASYNTILSWISSGANNN